MTEPHDSPVRIGTRGSRLALWQADRVRELLKAAHPGLEFERVVISTSGDRSPDQPADEAGTTGFFTREIEDALLAHRIDLAVHSLKDLPAALPDGLAIAAVLEREDPSDAFVARVAGRARSLATLRERAVVATGSPRRRAQILHLRPDIRCVDIRGNIDTRLRKLVDSEWDGLILARAGLTRLSLGARIAFTIDRSEMLPAAGQGAIAVEIRERDLRTVSLLAPINHSPSQAATMAERAFLHRLGGGCRVPVAALATVDGGALRIEGVIASSDGRRCLRDDIEGGTREGVELGRKLAEQILDAGGDEIMEGAPHA
jgi:hydroxymethylbilane synthase